MRKARAIRSGLFLIPWVGFSVLLFAEVDEHAGHQTDIPGIPGIDVADRFIQGVGETMGVADIAGEVKVLLQLEADSRPDIPRDGEVGGLVLEIPGKVAQATFR